MKIRTYLDFRLRIMGFYGRGCLYMQVVQQVTPAMVRPAEAAGIPVLPSSPIRFGWRKVRRSFMWKVKVAEVGRYPVRIQVSLPVVVPRSGGSALYLAKTKTCQRSTLITAIIRISRCALRGEEARPRGERTP